MIQKHELMFLRESLPRLIDYLIRLHSLRRLLTIIFHFYEAHTDIFIDDKLQATTKTFSEEEFETVKKQLLDGGFTVALKHEEDRKELVICS